MSPAAFMYPIIQAYDWWQLFQNHSIRFQIGGSDQFGNILTGATAIKSVRKTQQRETKHQIEAEPAMGFTVSLLASPSGEKYSKSAGNAAWLSPTKTSPSDLYQVSSPLSPPHLIHPLTVLKFFLNISDASIHQNLKQLTFIPLPTLATLMTQHTIHPHLLLAQHTLAKEVVTLVHGPAIAEVAERENMLYEPPPPHPVQPRQEISHFQKALLRLPKPIATLPLSTVRTSSLPKLLVDAGIVNSRVESDHYCETGGVYHATIEPVEGKLGWHKAPRLGDLPEDCGWLIIGTGEVIVVRVGKRKLSVIAVAGDG